MAATAELWLQAPVEGQAPLAKWLEAGIQNGLVTLSAHACPLNPGSLLRGQLWRKVRAAVATSASLVTCGSFDHFLHESGLAFDDDVQLRDTLFSRVTMFFFAGAGLSQAMWDAYQDLALRAQAEARGGGGPSNATSIMKNANMKIAQVTPLYEAVPPKLYGGTERVVAHLTDALVDLGHDVTLFASADARTRARLVPVRDQAIRLDPAPLKSDLAAHMTLLSEVLKRADEFDVIHFHTDMIHFPFFERFADKTLTTLHGRLDMKDIGGVYERWPQFGLVSISDDQRRPLPFANWKATGPGWQTRMAEVLEKSTPKSRRSSG